MFQVDQLETHAGGHYPTTLWYLISSFPKKERYFHFSRLEFGCCESKCVSKKIYNKLALAKVEMFMNKHIELIKKVVYNNNIVIVKSILKFKIN